MHGFEHVDGGKLLQYEDVVGFSAIIGGQTTFVFFSSDNILFIFFVWYLNLTQDGPLKNCHIPKNEEMTFGFWTCLQNGALSGKDEDGPKELWEPYFDELASQTIDAAKNSDQVVLTHATYRQSWRECVVTKLLEGGAKKENITVLLLTIDPDVKLTGLFYRTTKQLENSGMTMTDAFRAKGYDGPEVTLPVYIKIIKDKYPHYASNDTFEDVPDGFFGKTDVDVSGRDMSHLDGVDNALGLVGKRNDAYSTLTFEEIRDKVKAVDQKRDEEWSATGAQEILEKIMEKVTEDGEEDDNVDNDDNDVVGVDNTEELEKVAKRRSSLISVEYLERELDRSSLDGNSKDKEEKKKIMKARRSSLIITGKIEL
jgi:hypothetical protein